MNLKEPMEMLKNKDGWGYLETLGQIIPQNPLNT